MKFLKEHRVYFLLIAAILLVDQLTKYWALSNLTLHQTQWIIPNWLGLTLVFNEGAAWSFLAGNRWLLVAISIVTAVGFSIWFVRSVYRWQRLSLAIIIAGAIGNLIDRLWVGYVVDFFDFNLLDYLTLGSPFPIFNIADMAIVLGMIGLAITVFFEKDQSHGTR